jgi:hypothetical protein
MVAINNIYFKIINATDYEAWTTNVTKTTIITFSNINMLGESVT